ncbi:hypothetical protein BB561_000123 [Smittium simulii]|uniref:Uncharacterized protein n=1 Tax=Smittium simulii TaxID=133385 RepID=A0A2T9Z0M3_9FUNG|nr:hypothetical protein BB561_000123 [Smittium simulii]
MGQEHSGEVFQYFIQESVYRKRLPVKEFLTKSFLKATARVLLQIKPEHFFLKKDFAENFCAKKGKLTTLVLGTLLNLHLHCYKQKMSKKASNAITKKVAALLAKKTIKQLNNTTPEEFQNEIPDIHLQDNNKKRLHDLSGPRGRLYAHYDTSELQKISFISI